MTDWPGFKPTYRVPEDNSTRNETMADVIGNKTDLEFSDWQMTPSIMWHLVASYYHAHGSSFVYPEWAAPITLTDNDWWWAWSHWTIVEIIPADTITTAFDIHWIDISNISAVDNYELKLYKWASGSEIEIWAISFSRSSNFSQEGNKRIQVPPIPANTRISASLASWDSDGSTCDMKVEWHPYPNITMT